MSIFQRELKFIKGATILPYSWATSTLLLVRSTWERWRFRISPTCPFVPDLCLNKFILKNADVARKGGVFRKRMLLSGSFFLRAIRRFMGILPHRMFSPVAGSCNPPRTEGIMSGKWQRAKIGVLLQTRSYLNHLLAFKVKCTLFLFKFKYKHSPNYL